MPFSRNLLVVATPTTDCPLAIVGLYRPHSTRFRSMGVSFARFLNTEVPSMLNTDVRRLCGQVSREPRPCCPLAPTHSALRRRFAVPTCRIPSMDATLRSRARPSDGAAGVLCLRMRCAYLSAHAFASATLARGPRVATFTARARYGSTWLPPPPRCTIAARPWLCVLPTCCTTTTCTVVASRVLGRLHVLPCLVGVVDWGSC